MQSKNLSNAPPKRIVDFRVTSQHQIFYLAIWDDQAKMQEWIQDVYLVGCQRLIQEFFTSIEAEEEGELEYGEGRAARNIKKMAKPPAPFLSKWNLDNHKLAKLKKKYGKSKMIKKGAKKRSKKYLDEDARRISQKIEELEAYIERQPKGKMDYLLNFVINVFKKDGVAYCTVKTLPPERHLAVSIENMQIYFPQTLKDYYVSLLKLHNRKVSKNGQINPNSSSEDDSSDSNDIPDSDEQPSKGELQKAKKSLNQMRNEGYQEMNDF